MDGNYINSTSNLKDFQTSTDVKAKSDPKTGAKIAAYIDLQISGVSNYFYLRNQRFRQNIAIAQGRVNMAKFQDQLEMNGQINYTNLLWKSIMMGNTIVSRLVGKWMGRFEKIHVKAVDAESLVAKTEAENEANFILDNKEMLAQLSQASGVPAIGADQFVPEDKEAIEIWKEEWQRLPEEISQEIHTNNVLAANGFGNGGIMKEKLLHDSATCGLVGTKTYLNNDGVIVVKWVHPLNAVYSYTEYPDITNHCAYCGEIISMTITEIRDAMPNLTEQQIFELAQTAKDYQVPDKILWNNQWLSSIVRPYDDWNIDLIDFEVKTYNSETSLIVETKKNKSTIIKKVPRGTLAAENEKIVTKSKVVIYHGLYARTAHKLLTWEIKKNMIRPLDPKQLGDAEFSYSFYMYQNNDMRNLAIPEKIEEPLDQMILSRLKMQQIVAKMIPTGAAINIDALNEVDLGLGGESKPFDVNKVYDQTGRLYYRGRDAEGNPLPVPIQELANSGFLGQMQGLIQIYQFHYQVLKDELGEDPNLAQAAARPRVTEGNIQTSLQQADDATDYMYDAYLHLMEMTGNKVASLTRLSVVAEAGVYREITKEQVLNKVYTLELVELPDEQELAQLQAMLNNALATNPEFILYIDPFKCMRMAKDNLKLGEAYFRSCQRKAIQTAQQNAMQNTKANADAQQQSLQAKGQIDAQLEQVKGQMDAQKAKITADGLDKNALVAGIMQMYLEAQKTGQPLLPDIQPVAQAVLRNLIVPIAVQNQQEQEQLIQNMQQQQATQEAPPEQQMQEQQPQQQDPNQQMQEQQMQPQQAA